MTLIDSPVSTPLQQGKEVIRKDDFSSSRGSSTGPSEWKEYEKIIFRFFFLYFVISAIPLDLQYYKRVFTTDWLHLHFSDIFYLARYAPRFISDTPGFADWAVVALVALAGTVLWGNLDTKRKEYNTLYYALRVLLRYRLALALLAYGFIKLFPLQMPYPSVSNLNTNYGDFTDWKVFSLSTGIVPGYESFLGLVEITAALLLLYRKTVPIATFIIIPFTGNVVMSNLAYEGGEYVYGLYLVSIALFLLAYDALRLYKLTSLEHTVSPPAYKPQFSSRWSNLRIYFKTAFIFLFVFLYGFKTYAEYKRGPYQYPSRPGLANAKGIYNVTEFRLNGAVLPYSPNDPVRWKDVVFESWATLSIRSAKPVELVTASTEEIFRKDEERLYEFSGSAGRHYYNYEADTVQHVLHLSNRNGNYANDHWKLTYQRPDDKRIILKGSNASNDSIYVVLDKLDKKYLLEEAAKQGRRRGLKL
jgi:hypothetical protein